MLSLISCNNLESNPPKEYLLEGTYIEEIQQIKAFYNTGLDLAIERLEVSFPLQPAVNSNLGEKVIMGILCELNEKIYSLSNNAFNDYSLKLNNLFISKNQNQRTQYPELSDAQIFNESQIKISEPFIEKLIQTENPHDAKRVANSFENEIIKSIVSGLLLSCFR